MCWSLVLSRGTALTGSGPVFTADAVNEEDEEEEEEDQEEERFIQANAVGGGGGGRRKEEEEADAVKVEGPVGAGKGHLILFTVLLLFLAFTEVKGFGGLLLYYKNTFYGKTTLLLHHENTFIVRDRVLLYENTCL